MTFYLLIEKYSTIELNNQEFFVDEFTWPTKHFFVEKQMHLTVVKTHVAMLITQYAVKTNLKTLIVN